MFSPLMQEMVGQVMQADIQQAYEQAQLAHQCGPQRAPSIGARWQQAILSGYTLTQRGWRAISVRSQRRLTGHAHSGR